MSRENVEIVRRAFEAFNRGDPDAAVADFAPECDYIPSGAIPGATDPYRGPEGFKRFAGWLMENFDEARAEINEMVEAGEHVVVSVTNRGRGKQSGAEATWDVWQVWTLRDGRVVRGEGFTSREAALEAAGLPE